MTVTVTPEDSISLIEWREYMRALIRMDPEVAPHFLARGIRQLARAASKVYPDFERGTRVMLTADVMAPIEIPLTVEMLDALLQKSATVLLTGVDGPIATAEAMVAEIEEIADDER